ncbi:hypothetical protein PV328_005479 [Microctonus aethiopoides]|uniref:Major facilitator superfamily (MFS) profile domain-containing protein n=1 Tax=Microctonus aethiopoides TaxID=144406 RepID=A0AA39KSB5_9HYME|nr:hypothetical protein PV328_005479 [Microctonus aethiopoides]
MVLNNVRSSVSVIHVNDNDVKEQPADFKTALSATGFGAYNFFLVLLLIPAAWANAIDLTKETFLLASAECDFQMTLIRKSLLVSAVYIGMMSSSFFWSFVTDRVQRRPLFLLGLLVDALCNIVSSLVESFYVFLLLKFITGTIVGGPFTLLSPYLNEFQPTKYNKKFATWSGFIFSWGFIIPAILAFNILPQSWSFILFERVYPSWRIYLLLCSIPSVVGFFTMLFLPESPKQLMEDGQLTKAHELLKRMYVINTRMPANTYPIKQLELPVKNLDMEPAKTSIKKFNKTWSDIKELFDKKYLTIFFILNILQFLIMVGCNTMRLWAPHLFIIMNNFDYSIMWNSNNNSPGMCDCLTPGIITSGLMNETHYANQTCVQWYINRNVYINSSIIASSGIGFSFIIGLFYTTKMKKRISMTFVYMFTVLCTIATNWGQVVPLLMLAGSIVVTGRITSNIIIVTNTNVIPAPLRTTAIGILTHVGNFGCIIGNFIFPIILQIHCTGTFIAIGSLLIICLLISYWIMRSKYQAPETFVS